MVTRSVGDLNRGKDNGSFRGIFAWLSPTSDEILEETRTMTFSGDKIQRIVDLDITLKALLRPSR